MLGGEPVSRIPQDALNKSNFRRISTSNQSILSALSPSAGIVARFGHSGLEVSVDQ
jgi:hypothetical protein